MKHQTTGEENIILPRACGGEAVVGLAGVEVADLGSGADGKSTDEGEAFELGKGFCVDAAAELEGAGVACPRDDDIARARRSGSEVGVTSAEEEPWLEYSCCIEFNSNVWCEEEIGVLRAGIGRRLAGLDVEW